MTEKNDSELKNEMPDLPDSVAGLNGTVLPEDLAKLNLDEESKPWDKQFEDDLNEDGKPSRVAKNKKKRGVKALVFALFAALILLMFAPVLKWAIDSNSNPNSNNNIVATDKDKSKDVNDSNNKKSESNKKKNKKKSSESKKAKSDGTNNNSSSVDNKQAAAAAAKKQAEADAAAKKQAEADAAAKKQAEADAAAKKQAEDDAASKKQASDESGYYTVAAGENPFRIAYNHNMTTEELYSLNGLQPGTVLNPGMRLRVK